MTNFRIRKSAVIAILVTVLAIICMASCCTTIDSASVGIRFKKWSANTELKGGVEGTCHGWVWFNPITESIFEYPTYIQRVTYEPFTVNPKDAAIFSMTPTLAYQIDESRATDIFIKYRKPVNELELGYIKLPENTLIELNQINRYPMDQLVVITTGSQGEPMSALYRMAFTGHRQIEVGKDDRIIISASPIPGNEKAISSMVNELFRRGADVIYNAIADVHVSGHACQEELKIILALTRPKYFMPVHGECRHLLMHASLAQSCGVESKNIIIGDLGSVVELDGERAVQTQTVQSGRVLVDGLGVGDVGTAVLRERKLLSEDGIIVAETVLNHEMTAIISGPDILSRGFVYTKEAEELNEGMRRIVRKTVEECIAERKLRDRGIIKNRIREALSEYLYKQIKRSPMVLPIITEVQ